MQVRHDHGGCNSLARHVAQHEIESRVPGLDNIAVVATDDTDRLVMIGDLPSAADEILMALRALSNAQ